MDLSNTYSVSIKTEPGSPEEDGGEVTDADIDVDLQDVKKECLDYSDKVDQLAGKNHK